MIVVCNTSPIIALACARQLVKTPTEDLELIRRRLKMAESDYKDYLEKGKAS